MPFVRTEFADHIGTIALDHYSKRNALSRALIADMLAAFDDFRKKPARAVVLRSATNEKVWSTGHDVTELPKANIDPLPYGDPLEQLMRAVKGFPAPVIAMVHGSVWGGACELIMACDIVIADDTASFAITPARLGLPYNAAGFQNFISRLPLTIVKEMFFTADPIAAARAERVGIVNLVVPQAELESRTYAMAKTIAQRSPAAIAAYKEAIRVLSEAVAVNPDTYEYLHGLRRAVYFGPDYQEGIQAFLEKRPPQFRSV
ncbi:MAG: methylmalonyl-CoA decarboxylase [Alphaproteobacteria bacterium]|nr:methylmalonyl-CoA decarboxylase [Alphaproteobacteria bacterium]MDE1986964.1 methylmalonyl-CoA decarboxylase [Alphaproteobacteria bacterium]MDE2162968.1 methylmalonyl-CoA decarboxylase [Alphaproteobacteria bacterium]MDE2500385.1 methylmalonyl-CoA decarboxylase [Alphaproteobacteria bacterium]